MTTVPFVPNLATLPSNCLNSLSLNPIRLKSKNRGMINIKHSRPSISMPLPILIKSSKIALIPLSSDDCPGIVSDFKFLSLYVLNGVF